MTSTTHTARRTSIVRLLLSVAGSSLISIISLSACGSDDGKPNQPQAGASGATSEAGSGGSKAGSSGGGAQGEPQLGAACKRDPDCGGGYLCDAEEKNPVPVQGAPGGMVDQYLFLGGSCTPKRATMYEQGSTVSCDPTKPLGSQGCGADGVCDLVARTPNGGFLVGCRKSCDPGAPESGCRMGYQCGFTDAYCSEGCQTDADCRVGPPVDTNGDGAPDTLSFAADSTVTCDPSSSRCVHSAGAQASGQSCMRDDECPVDGVCIVEDAQVAGQSFPGGHCTRLGCELPGRECDNSTVCEPLRPWLAELTTEPLCFQHCKVGAEGADLRTGTDGHGEGCRAGYRCHYNGGPGAEAGVCVGGNYNAVTTNNIGSECKTNADCYSPYGLGYCLVYQVGAEALPGICTLFDCAVPGLGTDICGDGNQCVATGDGDETNCQHHCKDATQCAKGFACTDDDDDAKTPKNCIPPCLTDADCRSGEKCILVSTSSRAGLCRLQ